MLVSHAGLQVLVMLVSHAGLQVLVLKFHDLPVYRVGLFKVRLPLCVRQLGLFVAYAVLLVYGAPLDVDLVHLVKHVLVGQVYRHEIFVVRLLELLQLLQLAVVLLPLFGSHLWPARDPVLAVDLRYLVVKRVDRVMIWRQIRIAGDPLVVLYPVFVHLVIHHVHLRIVLLPLLVCQFWKGLYAVLFVYGLRLAVQLVELGLDLVILLVHLAKLGVVRGQLLVQFVPLRIVLLPLFLGQVGHFREPVSLLDLRYLVVQRVDGCLVCRSCRRSYK